MTADIKAVEHKQCITDVFKVLLVCSQHFLVHTFVVNPHASVSLIPLGVEGWGATRQSLARKSLLWNAAWLVSLALLFSGSVMRRAKKCVLARISSDFQFCSQLIIFVWIVHHACSKAIWLWRLVVAEELDSSIATTALEHRSVIAESMDWHCHPDTLTRSPTCIRLVLCAYQCPSGHYNRARSDSRVGHRRDHRGKSNSAHQLIIDGNTCQWKVVSILQSAS